MVCLQESKLGLINRAVIRSLWGGQHVDWSYLGSCGASRGVLLMWDTWVVIRWRKQWEDFRFLVNL